MSEVFVPNKGYFIELIRPWKLFSFACGMAWLIYGSLGFHLPDWNIGVSILMGSLTYLSAPWSVQVIFEAIRRKPKLWMLRIFAALLVGYTVADLVYWSYNSAMGNQMLRYENFMASLPLYFICGVFWLYRGSAMGLFGEIWRLVQND